MDIREDGGRSVIGQGHRSVSQLTSYSQCSERYRLERLDKVPQTPAGWTLQGLAVHETIEAWERSGREWAAGELTAIYRESWQKHLDRMKAQEPDIDRWLTGTPKLKGSADVERRHDKGLIQVADYIEDALASEWSIWETPDYDLAIELPFRIDLNGVEVVGYIDQVREWPDGSLEIVDLKTGSKTPEWDVQLGVYRLAVLEGYAVADPITGSFFMLKNGKYAQAKNLDSYTRPRLEAWFAALSRGIEANAFLPNPGGHCRMCSVWKYCSAT
ncbi:RecB family exonuclease [Kitasatospora sp. NPDC001309]|uniref:RecB family exonuclease n=1 Tax=Kitasatospora sp. NPDC001309 TaxID=3364013 RepID=UPI0036AE6519